MKLDNEAVVSCTSPPRKSYNPFDSDDDLLDCPASKAQNRLAKDNSIVYNLEEFSPTVDFPWEGAILVHPCVVDGALKVDGGIDNGLYGQGMELYTDKNVMDCEMSELIVSSYQSVKDICIDEGVPSQDKTWGETMEEMRKEKDRSGLFDATGECNGDMGTLKSSTENVSQIDSIKDSMKVSGVTRCVEIVDQVSPFQRSKDGLLNATDTTSGSAEGESVSEASCIASERKTNSQVHDATESSSLTENAGPRLSETGSISGEMVEDDPPMTESHEVSKNFSAADSLQILTSDVESSSVKPSHSDETKAEFNSSENPSENAESSLSSELSVSHSMADSSASIVSSADTNADSGRVTIVVNPIVPEAVEEKMAPSEDEVHSNTQSISRHAEGSSGKTAYVTLEQHFLGETSFSAGMPPPSSITYMGPVSYSGNISLRSESSAGSARSFAFPVLQTEWNGSPVRMARADQRRLRKNRGWLQTIVCCRF